MSDDSLYALGKQYAAEAENLEQLITACRERKRFAMAGGHSGEAQRQERLIELHTQQRGDVLRLSVWLRHYYDGKEKQEKQEKDATETYFRQKGEAYENHRGCIA